MVIFGPLAAPSTSPVTEAELSASAPVVTFSPSTSMTTGRLTESPTSWATLSISMTSPTATFCCWPPLRTIAYTADSLSSSDYEFTRVVSARSPRSTALRAGAAPWTHDGAEGTEDQVYGRHRDRSKRAGQRLREPFFLIGTWALSTGGSPELSVAGSVPS